MREINKKEKVMEDKYKEVMFEYLDMMQQEGYANMYTAPMELRQKFGISRNESDEVVAAWVKQFVEEIADAR